MATGRLAVLSNVNMNMGIRMLQKQAEVYDAEGYGNELGVLLNPASSYHAFQPDITFLIMDLAENSAICVPTMMPYITAFFMPRTKGDRPDVIPDGCVNAAFLGQFAETPRDTIFTTEYSVRTAMEAVYGLCGVDRGVPEVWGSVYDIRELLDSTVKLTDG